MYADPCRPLGYTDMKDAAAMLLKKRAPGYDPGTRPEARKKGLADPDEK
jgi:hypothetical protein